MAHELRPARILDRRLALEDGDEGIALISDPEQQLAHLGAAHLPQLGEQLELGAERQRTCGAGHRPERTQRPDRAAGYCGSG